MRITPEEMFEVQEYKGVRLTLPLDEETRKFLYSRGKDPLVAELDAQYANYEFRVNELKAKGEWDDDEDDSDEEIEPAPPYEQWKKQELVDEINERNAGREPEDVIDSRGTAKELAERLYADDEANEEAAE